MVRIGILGAGNIALRFARSLAHDERANLVAAACRTQQKAQQFLSDVPHASDAVAYAGYDALLADKNVDAIYLSLPHAYHYEWAVAALRAGKAVLCEKPAMLNAKQMAQVAQIARSTGTLFMEAMKPRFVPLYAQVMAELDAIGPLSHVEATLCNSMLDLVEGTGSYHMVPGPGAGVLLDCGTYCASWIAALCPEPRTVTLCTSRTKDGIDVYADAQLVCGDDAMTARLECAFDEAKPRTATLVGENGRIVVEELHRPQRATVHLNGEEPRVLDIPYEVDDFFGEIYHFVSLVQEGAKESPTMSLADSIACAKLLDTVRASL